jgi:hypothetical protein
VDLTGEVFSYSADALGEEPFDALRTEPPERHDRERGSQLVEGIRKRMVGADLGVPVRAEHDDGTRLHATPDEREQPQ